MMSHSRLPLSGAMARIAVQSHVRRLPLCLTLIAVLPVPDDHCAVSAQVLRCRMSTLAPLRTFAACHA